MWFLWLLLLSAFFVMIPLIWAHGVFISNKHIWGIPKINIHVCMERFDHPQHTCTYVYASWYSGLHLRGI